jgi:hypothetical protein
MIIRDLTTTLKSFRRRSIHTQECKRSVRILRGLKYSIGDRELAGMYQKGESARKYLNEISARNARTQEDINKKA